MERNYSTYSTSTVIQSLHPYYTYQIQVSAHTVTAGPYSIVQVLQMPEDGKINRSWKIIHNKVKAIHKPLHIEWYLCFSDVFCLFK